ncbi:unnamed protein product [Withania somnifera]
MFQMQAVCLNTGPVFDECEICRWRRPRFKERVPQPTVGLEFWSFDEAYDFYNMYGKEQGYGIRVSNSWFRSKSKEWFRAKLSCSNAGFKKKSGANHPETRTGCPAMLVIKLVNSKRWRIVEFKLQHNHTVSPEIRLFYKAHKKMDFLSKKQQESTPVTEIHTINLYRISIDASYNGSQEVEETDSRLPVDTSRHLELKEGDAHALYNYFCLRKLTNPNFFYLMDLDDERCLRNVFGADARSRAAFNYYSNAVAIDTTSLRNKYEIPLISFVGLNIHGLPVLLGSGFLGHDSAEYFIWMLKSWQTCFPSSPSLYCLSYIMQRVPEKLGGLKGYVYQYGLKENKWFQSSYEDFEKWVTVYLRDISFMGIMPIKVNEILDSYFGGYVQKHTSISMTWPCKGTLLRKFTKEIFKKFQKEVEGMFSCLNTRQININGLLMAFVVKERVESEGSEKEIWQFEVLYESIQVYVRCICSFYNGVEDIPLQYILPHWDKDYKRKFPVDSGLSYVDVHNPVELYNHLHRSVMRVVEEGAESAEHYKAVLQELEALL